MASSRSLVSDNQRALAARSHTRAIWRRRPLIAGIVFLFAIALQINYLVLIAPIHNYLVYRNFEPGPIAALLPVVASLGPVWFLPTKFTRPSDLALWLFYAIIVVPTAALALIATPLLVGDLLIVVAAMATALLLLRVSCQLGDSLQTPKLKRLKERPFLIFLTCITAVNVLYMITQVGFSMRLDAFIGDAHEGRLDTLDSLSASGFGAYVLGWQSRAIGPILLILALSSRRWVFAVFAVFGQLYMFSVTTQRSALLLILLIAGFAYLLDEKRIGRFAATFIVSFLALTTLAGAGYYLTDFGLFDVVNSYAVRRAIMLPAILTGNYFHIFSTAPVANYAGSILSFGAESVYQEPVQRVAGSIIYRRPVHANVNFFASGYANLRWIGVFIEALIASVALVIFDVSSRGLKLRIRTLCLATPAWALSESPALTSSLTHGLLLAALIAWLVPRSLLWAASGGLGQNRPTSRAEIEQQAVEIDLTAELDTKTVVL